MVQVTSKYPTVFETVGTNSSITVPNDEIWKVGVNIGNGPDNGFTINGGTEIGGRVYEDSLDVVNGNMILDSGSTFHTHGNITASFSGNDISSMINNYNSNVVTEFIPDGGSFQLPSGLWKIYWHTPSPTDTEGYSINNSSENLRLNDGNSHDIYELIVDGGTTFYGDGHNNIITGIEISNLVDNQPVAEFAEGLDGFTVPSGETWKVNIYQCNTYNTNIEFTDGTGFQFTGIWRGWQVPCILEGGDVIESGGEDVFCTGFKI